MVHNLFFFRMRGKCLLLALIGLLCLHFCDATTVEELPETNVKGREGKGIFLHLN